jgi:hypothetical protein
MYAAGLITYTMKHIQHKALCAQDHSWGILYVQPQHCKQIIARTIHFSRISVKYIQLAYYVPCNASSWIIMYTTDLAKVRYAQFINWGVIYAPKSH